jgi:hypothetical protein
VLQYGDLDNAVAAFAKTEIEAAKYRNTKEKTYGNNIAYRSDQCAKPGGSRLNTDRFPGVGRRVICDEGVVGHRCWGLGIHDWISSATATATPVKAVSIARGDQVRLS